MATVHASPFAGSWYPGSRAELESLLDQVFEQSRGRTGPFVRPGAAGFVVPHAGIGYSGCVAAAVYRHIQADAPRRIVLLGFSHRGVTPGIAVPDVRRVSVPTGELRLDRATMERLAGSPPFWLAEEERVCDHSVEIQFPMLRRTVPDVPLVPLYIGPLSEDERRRAAAALASLDEGTVFLASSDLTHYGRAFDYQPFPCDRDVQFRLSELDREILEAAGSIDPTLFLGRVASMKATACGYHPIALLLETLRTRAGGEVFQTTLDYQTSGEMTGDFRHSVSYGAAAYFPAEAFRLQPAERAALLESARRTLEHLRSTGDAAPVPPRNVTPALTARLGAFVSLHQGESLLGCIGTRDGRHSLARDIPQLTLSAATDDPRFQGVFSVSGEIELEISVLTPMKRIAGIHSFRPGTHGAWLSHGSRSALLLPQVGAERNWSGGEFFQNLSLKAGLGAAGWRDPLARLAVFQAEVFSDAPAAAAASSQ